MPQWDDKLTERLMNVETRLAELKTAQGYIEKDVADGLKELQEEARFTRRTALSAALSVLSAVLLAVLGLIFSALVK